MNKKIKIFLLILLASQFFLSCSKEENVTINKLEIVNTTSFLTVGEKIKLLLEVDPLHASINDVLFSSSNENIISVSPTGVIHALCFGEAIIKAYIPNSELEDEINITVKNYFDIPEKLVGTWKCYKIELIDKNGNINNEDDIIKGWFPDLPEDDQNKQIAQLRAMYSYIVSEPDKIKFGLAVGGNEDATQVDYMYGDGYLSYHNGNTQILDAKFDLSNFNVQYEDGSKWDNESFECQEIQILTNARLRIQTPMGENNYVGYYKVVK